MKAKKHYFTAFEISLWGASLLLILISFFIFGGKQYLALIASLIGASSLIFNAKGNPVGQVLMIIFSILYGIISYSASYYGEMITYLGMSLPIAVASLVAWIKNPFEKGKAEVKVNRISVKEYIFLAVLSVAVTVVFYFILKAFETAQLILSTVSVLTSFSAAYLTMRRSEKFALMYAANDIVLIALWVLSSLNDSSSVSVVVCFIVFLVNDLYGFINWNAMKKRQRKE